MATSEAVSSNPDLIAWATSQPLGVTVLIFLVVGFITGYLKTGKDFRREQERNDRLTSAFETLSKANEKAIEAAERSHSTSLLIHSLIQGIDTHLRNQQQQRRGE